MIKMYVVGFNSGHHWRPGGIFGHGPIVAREAAVQGDDVRFTPQRRSFCELQAALMAIP
jgi:hypothetical protein